MCGICGLAYKDNRPGDRALLECMNATIAHRGPDGDGFYIAPGVGLAMRRLAIIDLNTGDQPIANEAQSIWIVFNGEIYNFPELRPMLEQRGHAFRTLTDTECIVHLYEEYGVDCLQHLRGMFAFAIWDSRKQTLFIARDRLGKKPIYYTVQNDTLYFGSELSALFAALPQRPAINIQAIDLYLSLQYVPEPLTVYDSIFKLLPAHYLLWHNGDLTTERYWGINYLPKHNAPQPQLEEELRDIVCESVRIRLISDVPLGAHLSGGIDSSIVVAMMAEASSGPVKTFTINFNETGFSEIAYARAVAQRYATDHHEFTVTFDDIPGVAETITRHIGEPFADPSALPSYYLSKLTRQHVTVALNGDGGDEAFAGYHRYWLDPWANFYKHLPSLVTHNLVPGITGFFPEGIDRPVGQNILGGLKRLDQVAEVDARASILRWGSYFSLEQKRQLWKEPYRSTLNLNRAQEILINTFDLAPANSYLERTLFTDISTYLPGDLLVKADRMAMANSLEGRSPFLDHKLMEWSARLPENLKVRGGTGKYLLRKAFASYLPERVQGRGKQGFGVPVGAWLRGPLASWSQSLIREQLSDWFESAVLKKLFVEHTSGRVNHGKRLWALTMLAIWARQNG
jgi:asparagine synthase (glutamine-hydrolysing)